MSYASDVVALSPLVYWRLGEASGSTAEDASGNNRDGTYSGPTLGATGLLAGDADTAADFDGGTDVVTLADAAWMDVSTLTVVALFKPDTTTGTRTIVGRWNQGVQGLWLLYQDATSVKFVVFDPSALPADRFPTATVAASLTAGSTYYAAGYVDSGKVGVRVYNASGLIGSNEDTTVTSPPATGSTALTVGDDVSSTYTFDGVIDEVAVFGSVLSASVLDDLADLAMNGAASEAAVVLPLPVVAGSGSVASPGTAAVLLPAPVVSGSGAVTTTGEISGTAAAVLPSLVAAATGTNVSITNGSAAVTLPMLVIAAIGTGTVGSSGSAAVSLPLPVFEVVGVAHDPYEEEDPDAIDRVVLGSYQFKTRIRLVQGDLAERVDVIDGTYRFDAGSIPMRRIDAEIHYPTLDNPGLLDVAATKVTCAVVATTIDGDTSETIAQVPLWLQSIRKTVDGRGTRYQIEAVDILGRLSANGLQRPVQSASTCMRTIRRLLNNAGHHHGVLVWKDPDVTDRDAPDRAVFDGDPVYAAQEMVEQMDAIMVSIAPNAVRIMKAPRVNASATYTTDTVTSYTTVQERVPSKVLVESSSTDGSRDVTGTAGGAGAGDYGTVTARFYRPVRNSAQADRAARSLLARVKGRGYRLEQVEMIPNAAVAFGQTWKVKHSGASRGVVWSYDLPLVPNRPMILRMRTPEDA